MALFLLPFVTIAITMLSAATGGSPAMVPAIPLSFLGALAGFVLLVVATTRAKSKARRAGTAVGGPARGTGRPRGMRGDHPNAPSVDYPDSPSAQTAGAEAGGADGASESGADGRSNFSAGAARPSVASVRCQHCGVWSEPDTERGVRVCSRCGATLPLA